MEYIIIFCTVSNEDESRRIASSLVNKKLAACVNIVPSVKSVYYWENNLVEDNELLLIIKTLQSKFESVKNEILKIHSYEIPEIISVKINNGEENYLNWLKLQTDFQK